MYLYGASGHGKVIAEIAENNAIVIDGFIDDNDQIVELLGYPVLRELPYQELELVISIGNNSIRKRVATNNSKAKFISLLHKRSNLSNRISIGEGTVVMSGVTVNADTKIGKHCILNTNSSIDHDCEIGDFVHISPNVAIAGGVTIGEGSHIGIGACVIPGVKIGNWCVIGAGSVVIRDVADNEVIVGNPAKSIKIK